FRGAAHVIRMRMRGDEVVDLLHVVTLQRFDNSFAFGCVTGVDQYGFACGRGNQDRIAVDWSNVENANDELASRSRWRLLLQPGADPLPIRKPGSGDDG